MRPGIISFIKFYIKAKSKFRIHSPFVYDFIESVLEEKRTFYSFLPIEYFRKQLQKNNELIIVDDFGAGSKKIKGNQRDLCMKKIYF